MVKKRVGPGRAPVTKKATMRPGTEPVGGSEGRARISPEERRRMIAEAAYFRAERRGFAAGGELDDWVQAETDIDRLVELGGSHSRHSQRHM
jgi:hypothetical protein